MSAPKKERLTYKDFKLILAAVVVAAIALMWYSYSTSMTFTPGAGHLAIAYRTFPLIPKNQINIDYASVEQVQLFETAPAMTRTFGIGVGNVQVGNFTASGLGSFKAYMNHAGGPVLLIKTKDAAYMISPPDAATLKQTIEAGK